jgi:PDZ domain-containing protein
VQQGSAAKGKLRKGDVIRRVAGERTTDVSDVQRLVQAQRAGSTVAITVRRSGEERTVHVRTHAVDGHTVVGVLLMPDFDLPFTVNIDAGNVGGPSAGMMFSLGVYDKLTPGSLTDGKRFAGTGTIDSDGDVGPIGGIAQKMVGARDEGAHWFLAPERNCDDVVGHVPDGLEVVKVSTFDDALHLVKEIAGGTTSGLPRCGT